MGFIENVHFHNGLLLFEDYILISGEGLGSNDLKTSKIRMIGCVQSKEKIIIDPNNPCITIKKDSMVGCNFIFEYAEGAVYAGVICYPYIGH